jgi:putative Ca2+/H+ antiporter (TMEM165/GDT1 family)
MPFAARLAITALATAAFGALAYWVATVIPSAPPATCVETGCFCEAVGSVIPVQLEASLSSLAFVVLGVWALLQRPAAGRERRLVPLSGIALLLLGISSFLYHATLTFVGQWLDVFAMYLVGLLLGLGALWRSGRLSARASIALFIVLAVALGVAQYLYPDARRVLFALVLLPGIVLELTPAVAGRGPQSRRWVVTGLAVFVVAYVIWLLDQSPLCDPTSWLQGHAIWHTLCAVAVFLVTVHWRHTPHDAAPGVHPVAR